MICKIKENYYPQIFIEQCKYREKEKEIVVFISEDIEGYFSSSDVDDDYQPIKEDFE